MEIENDFFKKLSIRHNDAHSSEETNKTYSEDFDYFKFSKKSHLKFFRDSYIDYTLLGGELNENSISIYDYQNLLIYSTIKANLSKGAKILEIGSFNSTAKRISRDCELWRVNAPEELLTDFQQGTASMSISRYNDDSVKLKNSLGYFDFIFSNSIAMACASNIPIIIGSLRSPFFSAKTIVNDPACIWLGEMSNISNLILSKCRLSV